MTIHSPTELRVALRDALENNISDTIAALGWSAEDFRPVREWQQVPTLPALATASFPAAAIASPGLVSQPKFSQSTGLYTATWELRVGIYDRGRDYNDTAARIQDWCTAIRLTARAHPSLGGIAKSLDWRADRYDEFPNRDQARTIGGGIVVFDVTADVIDALGDLPTVASTPTPSVSVQ